MRSTLLAAATLAALAMAAPSQAATITDPVGDFLPSYAGPEDGDLDVISFAVTFDDVAQAFRLTAAMADDIDPSKAGLYAIGVNTGTGAIRPFGGIGAPNVIFNQVIAVQKTGAATIGGVALPSATVFNNVFSVVVPLALLPSTGFDARHYGFNIWPRNGLGNNNQISDFAPGNGTIATVPEPATWALMIGGFGLAGAALRRRQSRTAVPV